ncbi:sortase [Candidatus Gracilibacteria bacterium]|nr:sortase [Candidatus Gracilibacteria bacterium]
MSNSEFNFGLRPRRPFWKDALMFLMTVVMVWGGTHIFMNYNAFAQVASFKFDELKASVIQSYEDYSKPEKTGTLKLEKIEGKRRPIFRDKTLKPKNQAKETFETMSINPSDDRIEIARINKNVPLVDVPNHRNWYQLERNIQGGLQEGVVVHPISREPGQEGNFFVTGHSSYYAWDKGRFKDVFALLHEVRVGDVVYVYRNAKKYTYKIAERSVVAPTETGILNQPNDKKIITLMTCTPIGTNEKRLVLVGNLIEDPKENTI